MRCYYSKKYLKFPRGIVISGVIHPDPDANVTCKAKLRLGKTKPTLTHENEQYYRIGAHSFNRPCRIPNCGPKKQAFRHEISTPTWRAASLQNISETHDAQIHRTQKQGAPESKSGKELDRRFSQKSKSQTPAE